MHPGVGWNLLTQGSSYLCPVSSRIISKSHHNGLSEQLWFTFPNAKDVGCFASMHWPTVTSLIKEWFGSFPHMLTELFAPLIQFSFFGFSFILDICFKAILLVMISQHRARYMSYFVFMDGILSQISQRIAAAKCICMHSFYQFFFQTPCWHLRVPLAA